MTGFEQDVPAAHSPGQRPPASAVVVRRQFRVRERHPAYRKGGRIAAAGPVLFSPAMVANEAVGINGYGEILGVDPSGRHAFSNWPEIRWRAARATGDASSSAPTSRRSSGSDRGTRSACSSRGCGCRRSARCAQPPAEGCGTFRADAYPQDSSAPTSRSRHPGACSTLRGRASWVEIRLDDLRELDRRKAQLSRALGPGWIVMDLLEQNGELLKALNTRS